MLAADSFIVAPPRREPRAIAVVRPFRTVIAGYHWFTDWGRDTMISLGADAGHRRQDEDRGILRNFAAHVRDGLIPNLFPEHESEASITPPMPPCGSFTPSTATSRRPATVLLREMLPKLVDIVRHHITGTTQHRHRSTDGLLRQGERATSSPGWTPRSMTGW